MIKSPFKFLDSFTLADREIFFGRDQEITELYRRVFESKMLLVYGISGTGKSSLIHCGLASRFDDSDWLPVNVRRGRNIIESLNEAFNKNAIRPLKKNLSVSEKLQSIYLDHFKPVYLIFDQFEELFIFGSTEEKTGFIKLIKEIIESETQCHVIFIIREEFLAGITEFEYDLPEIFSNRFRIEKMKRANAIHAIEGPCKVHNIEIETGFSDELINKLCPAGNEIELTYLQVFLDRILRLASDNYPPFRGESKGGYAFTISLLSQVGNVSDLLGQFLEEQIREMDDPETGMSILKSFVSVQGTKRQMNESEIMDSMGAFRTVIAESDLLRYLSKFVDLRILRERDEAGHFELRHDALAAKIYEKFTISEKELLEVRLFIENAYQTFNTRKTYLNNDDLEYISAYEKRMFLPSLLHNFVQESKEKLHSQQRALRRLTTIVAIVFLIIIGAGIQYYLNQKGFSRTKELTTLALLQERVDPLTSINTAFKIRQKDSVSAVVRGIILSSFNSLLHNKLSEDYTTIPKELMPRPIPVNGMVVDMRMNKSGNHLYGWTDDKEVFIWDTSDSIVQSFKVENEVKVAEMSENGRYLAVVYKNSRGDVYKCDGQKLFAFETTVNHLMNNRLIRFFPSGKYFMVAVHGADAIIYDSTGTHLFDLTGHTGRINSLDISPDGRFVATASSDKNAMIWNFNHKTKMFSPYDTLIGHKDTVWSCEFNRTGKYILTASADSLLNIWNLEGKMDFIYLRFFINASVGECYWAPRYEPRLRNPERHFALMNSYYQKAYDATYATGLGEIIASNYKYGDFEGSNGIFRNQVVYRDVVYRDEMSLGDESVTNSFSLLAQSRSDSLQYHSYRSWEISPDKRTFAAVFNGKDNIMVISAGGYQMLSLPGIFSKFSKEGKFLYFLNKKSIHILPLDLREINSLILKKQIFGNPRDGDDIWKIL